MCVCVCCVCVCRVDKERVKAVGPDMAAAEWVLRLGGRVKFQHLDNWSTDYNRLPSRAVLSSDAKGARGRSSGREKLYLEAIDGTGVAITGNGLEHLGE